MSVFRWDIWRYGPGAIIPYLPPVPWPVSAILDLLGCEVERDLDWKWPA